MTKIDADTPSGRRSLLQGWAIEMFPGNPVEQEKYIEAKMKEFRKERRR